MSEPRRKRGREHIYDAQKTREAILNAAGAVFAEHGFDGTSVDAVAVQAGYNKSLLFQYFGSKLGLYAEVLKRADRGMGELLARVFAPLLSDETITSDANHFWHFLRTTFGALFDYMVEHPHVMRMINWEQAEGWQTFAKIASHFEPTDLARLEALFESARRAGLLRPDLDVVVMVVLVQQICWSSAAALPLYQLFLSRRNVSSATALTHVREQILDILVSGIMSNAGNESSGERREKVI